VHRLVRISPFARSRGATRPFASVFVYPEVDDEIEIEIKATTCASTCSRVGQGRPAREQDVLSRAASPSPVGHRRLLQQERSQEKQGDAMKMLKSRLYERALEAQAAKKAEVDKQKATSAFASQIRSYVFQPTRW